MIVRLQEFLVFAGALVACLVLLHYAWRVWNGKAATTNMASWLMWFVMDVVIMINTIIVKEPYLLALGFTIGAGSVFLVHLKKGTWKWTGVETFSVAAATTAFLAGQVFGGNFGIVIGTTAMVLAGMPALLDLHKRPERTALPVFAYSSVAGFLTLLGTLPWSLGASLFPTTSFIWNALVVWLIRPRRVN